MNLHAFTLYTCLTVVYSINLDSKDFWIQSRNGKCDVLFAQLLPCAHLRTAESNLKTGNVTHSLLHTRALLSLAQIHQDNTEFWVQSRYRKGLQMLLKPLLSMACLDFSFVRSKIVFAEATDSFECPFKMRCNSFDFLEQNNLLPCPPISIANASTYVFETAKKIRIKGMCFGYKSRYKRSKHRQRWGLTRRGLNTREFPSPRLCFRSRWLASLFFG